MSHFSLGISLIRMMAENEARKTDFDSILPEHHFIALCRLSSMGEEFIDDLDSLSADEKELLRVEHRALVRWVEGRRMDPEALRGELRSVLGKGSGSPKELHRSKESFEAYRAARERARDAGEEIATVIFLLEAILSQPPAALKEVLAKGSSASAKKAAGEASADAKGGVGQKEKEEKEEKDAPAEKKEAPARKGILARLGRDLTALARENALPALIGRGEEMRKLAQVLRQQRKCSAILVGDAGVGKTCVVEGFAQRIAAPDGPLAFKDYRIVEISMSSLVAGTSYRGEFEERIEMLVREAEADRKLVLFIDEFHTLMGAGKTGSGALDAANIFKPALSRGRIRLIGATTSQEYERHLARDDAIARRFEIIWIEEPARDETVKILQGLKKGMEEHHSVKITDDALAAAVDLSIRYLPDFRLPDKAIDLIDQACACQALRTLSPRPKSSGTAETAEPLSIGRPEIGRVIALRCRIPEELASASEQQHVAALEPLLKARIVGQEFAMSQVAAALRAAYGGLRDPRRPIASFLFAGPTGVGKTETGKALAEGLFGSSDALIQIDLSEYMEKHQVARLIGAPPGYTGYDEPGQLTGKVRQRPASIVVFDEIEKAHPDVLNILLQVLDEGQLTDGQGRRTSFRETIVILTTNISTEDSGKGGKGGKGGKMGFRAMAETATVQSSNEAIMEVLRERLRPELLGRIGLVLEFDSLNKDAMVAIIRKVFAAVCKRIQSSQKAVPPNSLCEELIAKAAESPLGAREIERRVESAVAVWLERNSG